MNTDGMIHPQSLVALTIIRTRGEFARNSRICSVAMFAVTLQRDGPAFALEHFAYDACALRADIISDITNRLPRAAAVLAAVPEIPRRFVRRVLANGNQLPPADIQLINRARPDLELLPVQLGQNALASAASSLGIPLADTGAPALHRARRAPDHAQALWAAFVLSLCRGRDRTNLITAFQAWTALQRARPIPF